MSRPKCSKYPKRQRMICYWYSHPKKFSSQVKIFKCNMLLPTFKKMFFFPYRNPVSCLNFFQLNHLKSGDTWESSSRIILLNRLRHTGEYQKKLILSLFKIFSWNFRKYVLPGEYWLLKKILMKCINLSFKNNIMPPETQKICILKIYF